MRSLIELQDAVNAKFAQVARVLVKHADPKLAAPAAGADDKGNLPMSPDVFFFNSKEEIPQYIVWNAELQSALVDREAAVDALCVSAEMSQILLGIKKGSTPDAARKLRLEATNSLAKVGRKAINIEPAIARAIEITQRLDQTSALRRQYPVDPVGVQVRDGLPVDEMDESQIVATYRLAGVMSVEAGVERRVQDPDAVAVELQRLAAERQAQLPSFASSWTGEPGEAAGPGQPAQQADQQMNGPMSQDMNQQEGQ